MHALVVKTSSMGDVIHTLPALSDARVACPDIRFDWVVERSLSQIPQWHDTVERVIPVSLRHWRKHPQQWLGRDVRTFLGSLRAGRYTHIIDAQGLLKSALIACLAHGPRYGYAAGSVRESPAALAYSQRSDVPIKLHAIERVRRLFADALDYPCPDSPPQYGIDIGRLQCDEGLPAPYLVFVHGSAWPSKSWPVAYWRQLVETATSNGYRVYLPWGDEGERARAIEIVNDHLRADLLPKLELKQLAPILADAAAVVSVDTGLGHLSAALSTPNVSIYGATDPDLTGTLGRHQQHLRAHFPCAPCLSKRCTYTQPAAVAPACYATVPPDQVWGTLHSLLEQSS